MKIQTLALFPLVALAIGGLAWVFLYPILSGERKVEQRQLRAVRTQPSLSTKRGVQRSRREQVEETLKNLEIRQKKSWRVPLSIRITQAGLSWSNRQFIYVAGALGLFVFALIFVLGIGLLPAIGFGFSAAFGLPFWILSFLKKRREARFLKFFPDAVDLIVRGIKAGLPLLDSLRALASDAQEPVKSEFRTIVETQTIGMPVGEACAKLYERVPVAEANFFAIVISVQQKAGGNLSEALGNLSRVLRDRKKMKAKISAMSMEAKASALIIAALPIAVGAIVYLTAPAYIELLWTKPLGQLMMIACVVWMTLGVIVMRKMINFDF
ncbi:MAG: type II secretion system F family protein [Pseudomonadota bacterium]|nr:type II secretion system F family protein [Pseudomonadota bacterium]